MDLSITRDKATAFSRSYGEAMELKRKQDSASIHEIAVALASHYNPKGFVSFACGHKTEFKDKEFAVGQVEGHLGNFVKNGLGLDVRLDEVRVDPVAPGIALCWMTWKVYPPADSSIEGWTWENVYSYREPYSAEGQPSGNGYWEFVVSDNEILELSKRFPDFFQ